MPGYYPNSNAKPRGSNLKAKMQTLLLSNFGKHVDLNILVQSYIQIYITHNNHKHTQTYLQITIHILANINNKQQYLFRLLSVKSLDEFGNDVLSGLRG